MSSRHIAFPAGLAALAGLAVVGSAQAHFVSVPMVHYHAPVIVHTHPVIVPRVGVHTGTVVRPSFVHPVTAVRPAGTTGAATAAGAASGAKHKHKTPPTVITWWPWSASAATTCTAGAKCAKKKAASN